MNCLTLTPTRMPLSRVILAKGTPLSKCWYSVSWKKMMPPMQLLMRSSALKRICRYCLRFCSVFSTPTWASRLAMLPAGHTLGTWVKLRRMLRMFLISDRTDMWLDQRRMNGEFHRPTDSSAARMPFPGETMRRAVSCSSLFCASESAGNWCVILRVWLSYSFW